MSHSLWQQWAGFEIPLQDFYSIVPQLWKTRGSRKIKSLRNLYVAKTNGLHAIWNGQTTGGQSDSLEIPNRGNKMWTAIVRGYKSKASPCLLVCLLPAVLPGNGILKPKCIWWHGTASTTQPGKVCTWKLPQKYEWTKIPLLNKIPLHSKGTNVFWKKLKKQN